MNNDDSHIRNHAEDAVVAAALTNPTPARVNEDAIAQLVLADRNVNLSLEQDVRLRDAIQRISQFDRGLDPVVIHLDAANGDTNLDIDVDNEAVNSLTQNNKMRLRNLDGTVFSISPDDRVTCSEQIRPQQFRSSFMRKRKVSL